MIFGNLFWGNHLDYFCIKFRSMDAQVLFRSFHTKIIQSTTAITSIVIRLANQLRIKCESIIFRHCEANRRFAEAIQKNNRASAQPNLARFIYSTLNSQSIRATNRNGRNCGGGFVFARIFGIETRLGVCEIPKILTSAKDARISELPRNGIYLQIPRESTAFKANLI